MQKISSFNLEKIKIKQPKLILRMPTAPQEVLIFPSRFAPEGRIRVNNTQPRKTAQLVPI
jgi:hypothetical protein